MSLTEDLEIDPWEGDTIPRLSAEEIREILQHGTPETIRALRDAGLIPPSETFRLETLDHVDWYGWRLREIDAELVAIQTRAQEDVRRLERERERLEDLYGEDAERIVAEAIKAQGKGKTLGLRRVKARLRTIPGGPRIADEELLLAFIASHSGSTREETELEQAVRASRTETLTGWNAIVALSEQPEEWRAKVLSAPVKAFVKSLPPVPDPETGEALPATIPGVVIEPASERLTFE